MKTRKKIEAGYFFKIDDGNDIYQVVYSETNVPYVNCNGIHFANVDNYYLDSLVLYTYNDSLKFSIKIHFEDVVFINK